MAGLAAVGCGGGESEPAKTGTQAAAKSTPRRGGTLQLSADTPAAGLDPILTTDARTMHYSAWVYSSLWKDKIASGLSAWNWEVEPDLAVSSEQADNVTTVYKLRPNVKWQDKPPLNGRAFTAEDISWTFKAYLSNAKSPSKSELDAVDKVDVVDPQTLRVTTKSPRADFNAKLTSRWVWVLPKEIGEADGDFTKRMVGTGPFMLDSVTENVGAKFVRNPGYYDQQRPYIDAISATAFGDDARRQAAFLTKNLHQWAVTNEALAQQIISRATDIQVFDFAAAPEYLVFRSDKPPFNDVRVRQAVMLTLDWDAMVKRFGGSKGQAEALLAHEWTQWALPKSQWGEGAEFHSKPNIQKAKQLLSAAGFPNGLQTKIGYNAAYQGQIQSTIGQLVQEAAAQAGVKLDISPFEPAVYARVLPGLSDWDGILVVGLVRYQDPDSLVGSWLRTGGDRGAGHISDPKIDQLIEAERKELNVEKRKAIFWDIEKYNLVQNYVAPLFTVTNYDLLQSAVGGYSPRPETHAGWAQGIWLNA